LTSEPRERFTTEDTKGTETSDFESGNQNSQKFLFLCDLCDLCGEK
jgi:hypothetical protein